MGEEKKKEEEEKKEKKEEEEEGHISKLPAAARLACHHGDMRG